MLSVKNAQNLHNEIMTIQFVLLFSRCSDRPPQIQQVLLKQSKQMQ